VHAQSHSQVCYCGPQSLGTLFIIYAQLLCFMPCVNRFHSYNTWYFFWQLSDPSPSVLLVWCDIKLSVVSFHSQPHKKNQSLKMEICPVSRKCSKMAKVCTMCVGRMLVKLTFWFLKSFLSPLTWACWFQNEFLWKIKKLRQNFSIFFFPLHPFHFRGNCNSSIYLTYYLHLL